jgi:hypothetical protein
MNAIERPFEAGSGPDTGTAYGRPAPTYRAELTEVGPGKPMGELLRRYWHPIGLSSDAGTTPPRCGCWART